MPFAVGAIPEQVDDGKSGYLVEAGDNQKFAAKLKEAMQLSVEQYDAMSRDAYQYGSKKYATSGAVERFVELLEEINDYYKNAFSDVIFLAAVPIWRASLKKMEAQCFLPPLISTAM